MGYFSNSLEALEYEAQVCQRCAHAQGEQGNAACAVWMAHFIHNYDECNNEQSILHELIPKSPDGLSNDQCAMFLQVAK